jgi:streptogramin lyase
VKRGHGRLDGREGGARARAALAGLLAGALLALVVSVATAAAAPLGMIQTYKEGIAKESDVVGIASGPEGNLWFAEGEPNRIGRITPSGAVKIFPLAAPVRYPKDMVAGADGNLWFTETGGAVGRITPAGEVKQFVLGNEEEPFPFAITLGPEGNVWFTERNPSAIARITPGGEVKAFSKGITSPTTEPDGIATGPEGNLWFTEYNGNAIGRITPAGAITEYTAGITPGSHPAKIVLGPDGNLWFSQENEIGKITPEGHVTEYEGAIHTGFAWIAIGPDGDLWATGSDRIWRINMKGESTELGKEIAGGSEPGSIVAGPDGSMWFTEFAASAIAEIGTGFGNASVAPPGVTGDHLAGSPQQCAGALWSTWAGPSASASALAFDGYRWYDGATQIASGSSYTPSAAQVGHSLSCEEIVTYPLQSTTATAHSASVTVLAPPPPPAPAIAGLHQSASVWREGTKLASLSRSHRRPIGDTFMFSLNVAAGVTVTFTQPGAGRKVKGKCVAPLRSNRHKPACRRTLTKGSLTLSGHAGTDTIRFQGRLSRSRRLAPGSYTMTLVASSGSLRSKPVALRFTIVK